MMYVQFENSSKLKYVVASMERRPGEATVRRNLSPSKASFVPTSIVLRLRNPVLDKCILLISYNYYFHTVFAFIFCSSYFSQSK